MSETGKCPPWKRIKVVMPSDDETNAVPRGLRVPEYEIWKPDRLNPILSELTPDAKETLFLCKAFTGILNRLTWENFEKLSECVKSLNIDNPAKIHLVVDLIHKRAIAEKKYRILYVQMCDILRRAQVADDQKTALTSYLVSKCELFFSLNLNQVACLCKERKEIDSRTDKNFSKSLKEAHEQKENMYRKNLVANCEVIGELFKFDMIHPAIIFDIFSRLSKATINVAIECICTIITTIGPFYEEKIGKFPDSYFTEMESILKSNNVPVWVRFHIQELLDLKNRNWRPKNRIYSVRPTNIPPKEPIPEPEKDQKPIPPKPPFEERVCNALKTLTPENITTRVASIIPIENALQFDYLVDIIFQKATSKPDNCELYAKLCNYMWNFFVSAGNTEPNPVEFKTLVARKCMQLLNDLKPEEIIQENQAKKQKKPTQNSSKGNKDTITNTFIFMTELIKMKKLTPELVFQLLFKIIELRIEESFKLIQFLLATHGKAVILHFKYLNGVDEIFQILEKFNEPLEDEKYQANCHWKSVLKNFIYGPNTESFINDFLEKRPKPPLKNYTPFMLFYYLQLILNRYVKDSVEVPYWIHLHEDDFSSNKNLPEAISRLITFVIGKPSLLCTRCGLLINYFTKWGLFSKQNVIDGFMRFSNTPAFENNRVNAEILKSTLFDSKLFKPDDFKKGSTENSDPKIVSSENSNDKIVSSKNSNPKIVPVENPPPKMVSSKNSDPKIVSPKNSQRKTVSSEKPDLKTVSSKKPDLKMISSENSKRNMVSSENSDLKMIPANSYHKMISLEDSALKMISEDSNRKMVSSEKSDLKMVPENSYHNMISLEDSALKMISEDSNRKMASSENPYHKMSSLEDSALKMISEDSNRKMVSSEKSDLKMVPENSNCKLLPSVNPDLKMVSSKNADPEKVSSANPDPKMVSSKNSDPKGISSSNSHLEIASSKKSNVKPAMNVKRTKVGVAQKPLIKPNIADSDLTKKLIRDALKDLTPDKFNPLEFESTIKKVSSKVEHLQTTASYLVELVVSYPDLHEFHSEICFSILRLTVEEKQFFMVLIETCDQFFERFFFSKQEPYVFTHFAREKDNLTKKKTNDNNEEFYKSIPVRATITNPVLWRRGRYLIEIPGKAVHRIKRINDIEMTSKCPKCSLMNKAVDNELQKIDRKVTYSRALTTRLFETGPVHLVGRANAIARAKTTGYYDVLGDRYTIYMPDEIYNAITSKIDFNVKLSCSACGRKNEILSKQWEALKLITKSVDEVMECVSYQVNFKLNELPSFENVMKKNQDGNKALCRFFSKLVNKLNEEAADSFVNRLMEKLLDAHHIELFCEIYLHLSWKKDQFEKSLFHSKIPDLVLNHELKTELLEMLEKVAIDYANR